AFDDEGIEAVEGAKDPLHQAATLRCIWVGIGEAAEVLGPCRRAVHGNGIASLARDRAARPAPTAADGDPEQDHAAGSIGTRSVRTSKKMQVHGTMRLAVSANIPPNWSRGAGWLGGVGPSADSSDISYYNAATLWLIRNVERGLHRSPTSRSCRICCRHSLNVGQPFRRGALGERSGRGPIDGSPVGFCAGPAGRMRACRRSGNDHAHRIDRLRSFRPSSAGPYDPRAQSGSEASAKTSTRAEAGRARRPARAAAGTD